MTQISTGKLFLIPCPVSDDTNHKSIPDYNKDVIKGTQHYLVENVRTARRFISSLNLGIDISSLHFEVLDKETKSEEIEKLIEPLLNGSDMGIISEAGCPGIADPGALAVQVAHAKNIEVVPLVGPSSILMAMMGSGFYGQSFAFNGYLPIDKSKRSNAIKNLVKKAQQGQAQIFMETPYRNQKLLEELMQNAPSQQLLCIARDVTGKMEYIKTERINWWKQHVPDLNKIPVIFILG